MRTFGRWGEPVRPRSFGPVTGVHPERRRNRRFDVPQSLARRCAAGLVVLVLVIATATPATAQTHASVVQTQA